MWTIASDAANQAEGESKDCTTIRLIRAPLTMSGNKSSNFPWTRAILPESC
jgi:hypothetical protein